MRPCAAVVVAVAVSVAPVEASLEAAARIKVNTAKLAAGLLSVMVPVAGLVGFSTTVNVKWVESLTVTVNRPLYSVWLAPEMVTLWPVLNPCAVLVAAVTVVPERVRLATEATPEIPKVVDDKAINAELLVLKA